TPSVRAITKGDILAGRRSSEGLLPLPRGFQHMQIGAGLDLLIEVAPTRHRGPRTRCGRVRAFTKSAGHDPVTFGHRSAVIPPEVATVGRPGRRPARGREGGRDCSVMCVTPVGIGSRGGLADSPTSG